eukprot:symbB.v1.2.009740.t1/scaffold626.1/size179291/2
MCGVCRVTTSSDILVPAPSPTALLNQTASTFKDRWCPGLHLGCSGFGTPGDRDISESRNRRKEEVATCMCWWENWCQQESLLYAHEGRTMVGSTLSVFVPQLPKA